MELVLRRDLEIKLPDDTRPPEADRVEQVEQAATPDRKGWSELVVDIQGRYQSWKKGLLERTDKSLEQIADKSLEQYEAGRDPVTGEVPSSYLNKLTRGIESIRKSTSLRNRFELGVRAALPFAELNVQMAYKQFGIDIAIRQAEYVEIQKKYEGRGGVQVLEQQALDFAQQVREQFERLNTQAQELPTEETVEGREQFRQKKITEGLAHAEQLLAEVDLNDPAAKPRILAELRVYLDTVVYDPNRPGLLQRWDKLGRGYRGAIQDILTKHVDLYQKRSARNKALFTTGARWLTFGLESYIGNRAISAASTLQMNYDKALMQLPAEQRSTTERMKTFGRAVKEGMMQFAFSEPYRQLRGQTEQIDQYVDSLIPDEQNINTDQQAFDVDGITAGLMQKYKEEISRAGLTEQQVYDSVEDVAFQLVDRRKRLGEVVKYKILQLHRAQLKASVRQAEHLYNQYNVNVTAVSMLAAADTTVEHIIHVREHLDQITAKLASDEMMVKTVVADLDPQFNAARGVVEAVIQEVAALTVNNAQAEVKPVTAPVVDLGEETVPVPDTTPHVYTEHYMVHPNDHLETIAKNHLEAYRVREHNDKLTVQAVIGLIEKDNGISDARYLRANVEIQLTNLGTEHTTATGEIMHQAPEIVHDPFSAQDIKTAAREVDSKHAPDNFVHGVARDNLRELPKGEYEMALGERMGKKDHTLPVYYSEVVHVTMDARGDATVRRLDHPDSEAVTLDTFLSHHKEPVVRVFQLEGDPIRLPVEHLQSDQWSEYNLAKIKFLQDHPVRVVAADGTYCAKDAAGRLDLFSKHLSSEVGLNLRDGQGHETGVTADAPMVAAAEQSMGGQEVMTLDPYFEHSAAGAHPIEQLDSPNPVYHSAVDHWMKAAQAEPLREATFLFGATHIENIIGANHDIGGESNSHVVTLLGEKDLTTTVQKDGTVADVLAHDYGIHKHAIAERGWVFESLGIEVNGVKITSEADWIHTKVHSGDHVVIHDVALNHRFNGDRADTLAMMMVRVGNLTPVSILEPNARIMNDALANHGEANDYVVDTFAEVQSGDSLTAIFAREHLDRSLWQAAEYAAAERGIDAHHIKPGELVPIYNEAELRDHLDEIYERAERNLATHQPNTDQAGVHYATADRAAAEAALRSGDVQALEMAGVDYWHIVRPGESMDALTQQFFDRDHYSAAEWGQIRDRVATDLGITHSEKTMPGDEYTSAYRVWAYDLTGNAKLHLTLEQLRDIDQSISEHRLAVRTYLPETLPLADAQGNVVNEALPKEVAGLIDAVVDSHPEFDEKIRVSLALVYANEGMRGDVDPNILTRALEFINVHHILDTTIEIEKHAISREGEKDIAWEIHDSPLAHSALEAGIQYLSRDAYMARVTADTFGLIPADLIGDLYDDTAGKLEHQLVKLEGVSSTGSFQVRAANFELKNTPAHEQLERELRDNPLLNTTAAAELLRQNAVVIDTDLQAFGDPHQTDDQARILAIVGSYNGGPYKMMLGGLQADMLQLQHVAHIDTELDRATGRGTPDTRVAFEQLCTELVRQGKMDLTPEEIHHDAGLLGGHSVGFFRSHTMQELKKVYAHDVGHEMSLLPTVEGLANSHVSYGNYALLSDRGGALDAILEHSDQTRIAKNQPPGVPYARADAPFTSGNTI